MYITINNNKINILEYKTFKDKLFGLMGKKEKLNYGILLIHCNSIHTFFMKQSIDVCITDKNHKILFLKENMGPNKVIFPIKRGYYVYELPLNSVKELKVGIIVRRNENDKTNK